MGNIASSYDWKSREYRNVEPTPPLLIRWSLIRYTDMKPGLSGPYLFDLLSRLGIYALRSIAPLSCAYTVGWMSSVFFTSKLFQRLFLTYMPSPVINTLLPLLVKVIGLISSITKILTRVNTSILSKFPSWLSGLPQEQAQLSNPSSLLESTMKQTAKKSAQLGQINPFSAFSLKGMIFSGLSLVNRLTNKFLPQPIASFTAISHHTMITLSTILTYLIRLYCGIEVLFYIYYVYRRQVLGRRSTPQDIPPTAALRRAHIRRLMAHVIDSGQCPITFLRRWFYDAPWSEIRLENIRMWVAASFFNKNLEELSYTEHKEIDNSVVYIIRAAGLTPNPGFNPKVHSLRFTLDPLATIHRPLIMYGVTMGASKVIGEYALRSLGFERKKGLFFNYWHRSSPHPQANKQARAYRMKHTYTNSDGVLCYDNHTSGLPGGGGDNDDDDHAQTYAQTLFYNNAEILSQRCDDPQCNGCQCDTCIDARTLFIANHSSCLSPIPTTTDGPISPSSTTATTHQPRYPSLHDINLSPIDIDKIHTLPDTVSQSSSRSSADARYHLRDPSTLADLYGLKQLDMFSVEKKRGSIAPLPRDLPDLVVSTRNSASSPISHITYPTSPQSPQLPTPPLPPQDGAKITTNDFIRHHYRGRQPKPKDILSSLSSPPPQTQVVASSISSPPTVPPPPPQHHDKMSSSYQGDSKMGATSSSSFHGSALSLATTTSTILTAHSSEQASLPDNHQQQQPQHYPSHPHNIDGHIPHAKPLTDDEYLLLTDAHIYSPYSLIGEQTQEYCSSSSDNDDDDDDTTTNINQNKGPRHPRHHRHHHHHNHDTRNNHHDSKVDHDDHDTLTLPMKQNNKNNNNNNDTGTIGTRFYTPSHSHQTQHDKTERHICCHKHISSHAMHRDSVRMDSNGQPLYSRHKNQQSSDDHDMPYDPNHHAPRHTRPSKSFGQRVEQAENEDGAIVFCHGIGVGAWTYFLYIKAMVERYPYKDMFLPEFEFVSMKLNDYVPSVRQQVSSMRNMLLSHGFMNAVFQGHSYGTFVVSHVLRFEPSLASYVILIDPVPFLLAQVDAAFSFIHPTQKPPCTHEFLIDFVAQKELGVSHALSRHLWWYQSILWLDHLPSGSTIVLSGKDAIVPSAQVRNFLQVESHRVRILWLDRLGHAGFCMNMDAIHQILDTISPHRLPRQYRNRRIMGHPPLACLPPCPAANLHQLFEYGLLNNHGYVPSPTPLTEVDLDAKTMASGRSGVSSILSTVYRDSNNNNNPGIERYPDRLSYHQNAQRQADLGQGLPPHALTNTTTTLPSPCHEQLDDNCTRNDDSNNNNNNNHHHSRVPLVDAILPHLSQNTSSAEMQNIASQLAAPILEGARTDHAHMIIHQGQTSHIHTKDHDNNMHITRSPSSSTYNNNNAIFSSASGPLPQPRKARIEADPTTTITPTSNIPPSSRSHISIYSTDALPPRVGHQPRQIIDLNNLTDVIYTHLGRNDVNLPSSSLPQTKSSNSSLSDSTHKPPGSYHSGDPADSHHSYRVVPERFTLNDVKMFTTENNIPGLKITEHTQETFKIFCVQPKKGDQFAKKERNMESGCPLTCVSVCCHPQYFCCFEAQEVGVCSAEDHIEHCHNPPSESPTPIAQPSGKQ